MISDAYRAEQEKLHENPEYGRVSELYAPFVSKLINEYGFTDMLDYGAGKARLAKNLQPNHEVTVNLYDPGVPDYASTPDSAQLVTCLDVLEHIEPEFLEDVLDDLQRVVECMGVFSIHTGAALKTLSDGRNAHLIQEPASWWLPKIMARFDLQLFQRRPDGFLVLVKRYGD